MTVSPWVVAAVGSLGGLIFGYDTGIIAPALQALDINFSLDEFLEGILTSSILLGAMFGSLAGSVFTTKLGRKFTCYLASGICLFGSTGSAVCPNLYLLMVIRLILGFGIGLISVLCPLYVSENAPKEKRGIFGVIFQLSITFGILVSYFVGWLINFLVSDPLYEWRIMIGIGGIFPLFLILVTFGFVEDTYGQPVLTPNEHEKLTNTIIEDSEKGWRGLFCSRKNWGGLLRGFVLAITLQLTGINALMYYGPSILQAADFADPVLLNIGIGGWNFLTTFIAIFLIERAGRRPLVIIGTLAMSIALVVAGVSFKYLSGDAKVAGIIVSLAIFLAGFEGGIGCLFWVLVNEVFDEEVREAGGSFSNILQWAFNLLVSALFKIAAERIGYDIVFYFFGGVGILSSIYMFFWLRETKYVTA